MRRLDRSVWFLVALFTWVAASCTHVNSVPSYVVGPYPPREKYPLRVELQKSDELRRGEFQQSVLGSQFKIVLGGNLAQNAEVVAKSVFSDVSAGAGLAGPRTNVVDATLTPRLVFVDQTRGMWASSESTLTISLEWSLRDVKGDIVWIDTVKGEGKGREGGRDSREQADRRIKLALDDLFQRSYEAMSSSPEIRAFSISDRK